MLKALGSLKLMKRIGGTILRCTYWCEMNFFTSIDYFIETELVSGTNLGN